MSEPNEIANQECPEPGPPQDPKPPECPVLSNPPEYFVYVIFHGVFAFYDDAGSDVIDVFVAKSEEHDCMAGSYMSEHPVRGPKGILFLTGVAGAPDRAGVNRLRDHEYVIHASSRMTPSPDYGAHILLPRPSKIYWDMVIDGVKVDFALQESSTQSWAHVPIFAYRCNGKRLALCGTGDFLWTPPADERPPFTLHIWASGDMPTDGGGPKEAAKLLGESVHVTIPHPFPGYRRDVPDDLQRRSYECSWRLTERFALLRELAAALRDRKSEEDPMPLTPQTMTILQPSACGPVGNGG
jgi:hypothetical protein